MKHDTSEQIVVPVNNQRDYDELPEHLKEEIQVHFAGDYKEVEGLLL